MATWVEAAAMVTRGRVIELETNRPMTTTRIKAIAPKSTMSDVFVVTGMERSSSETPRTPSCSVP